MYDCVACQIRLELATGVDRSGLYSELESKEELLLARHRNYADTRNGRVFPSAEPLGCDNIEMFLEEVPSCALDQNGRFSVNSMREPTATPAEAREMIADSIQSSAPNISERARFLRQSVGLFKVYLEPLDRHVG
jgi:hypothetical protein